MIPASAAENVVAHPPPLCSLIQGVHGLLVHHTPSIEPTISFIETLYHLLEGELKAKGVPVVLPESSAFRPFQPSQALPNFAEVDFSRHNGAHSN
jgi:hypothetical protein